LEDALIPRPLLAEPLSIMVLEIAPLDTPCTSYRVKKVSKLIIGVIMYIVENINKMLNTILEVWEVLTNLRNFSQRISSLTYFLQQDLDNEKYFIKIL